MKARRHRAAIVWNPRFHSSCDTSGSQLPQFPGRTASLSMKPKAGAGDPLNPWSQGWSNPLAHVFKRVCAVASNFAREGRLALTWRHHLGMRWQDKGGMDWDKQA